MREEEEEEGDGEKNGEVKKGRQYQEGWVRSLVEGGEEQSHYRSRHQRKVRNSREERKKKAVIGRVWCLSNTERPVMIPLAPHTERGTWTQRETE